jgi:peptide chain release factor subunit 3
VLSDPKRPVQVVRQFEAQLAILDSRNIIAAGFSAMMHVHALSEEITIQALLHYYDKKTGRKSRKPPQFAKKGECAERDVLRRRALTGMHRHEGRRAHRDVGADCD